MKIKEKIKIIAEIGLNHLGDEKLANKLVNDLLKTNIDGFSFQVKNKKLNILF
jgi:sialic acid synthase SpsE